MSMDKVVLGLAMQTAIDSYIATVPEPKGENLDRTDLMEAFAEAIIDHIKNNAVIDIKGAFTTGVPVINDGGAALKTAWSAQPPLTGVIS